MKKNKNVENLLETLLESAEAECNVAADELGADGVGFDDVADRVVENVAEEVENNQNFCGLSEENEENFEKTKTFQKKLRNSRRMISWVPIWRRWTKCELESASVRSLVALTKTSPMKRR